MANSLEGEIVWHKPQPARQRFSTIVQNQSDAVHIILGEPGGGKTTLLSKWAHDAYAAYQKDAAQPLLIYMRLRELGNSDDKNAALASYYKRLRSDAINVHSRSLAVNPDLVAKLIGQLAGDEDIGVRLSLAANPNLAAEVMVQMAGNEDSNVRRSLAVNPNLAAGVMRQLARDEDFSVRRRLAENPNVCWEVFLNFAFPLSLAIY